MKPILYVRGDATEPQGEGAKIIAHCCNNKGAWGRGFVLALSRRWLAPERAYRTWYRSGHAFDSINHRGTTVRGSARFTLGEVQLVAVEPHSLYVANLIGQDGIRSDRRLYPPVRYDALRQGLRRVAHYARKLEASVHMPRIGAGLAGGRWGTIASIISDELLAHDVPVTVYDLPRFRTRSEGQPHSL